MFASSRDTDKYVNQEAVHQQMFVKRSPRFTTRQKLPQNFQESKHFEVNAFVCAYVYVNLSGTSKSNVRKI